MSISTSPVYFDVERHGRGRVPRGAVIAFSGTLADIPPGWLLCDGARGTPDLRERMVFGANETHRPGARAGGAYVEAATSTDGAHTGGGGLIGLGRGARQAIYGKDIGGGHSHPLTARVDLPPSRNVAFVQSGADGLELPAMALVWSSGGGTGRGTAPAGAGYAGRFLRGARGGDRSLIGAGRRAYRISTGTAGLHRHGVGDFNHPFSGTRNHGLAAAGAHTHPDITGTTSQKPPYLVMDLHKIIIPVRRALGGMVLGYNGPLDALPSGWVEYAPLRGRVPMASGGALAAGAAGGTLKTINTGRRRVPAAAVAHSHFVLVHNTRYPSHARHTDWVWTHGHAWSGVLDPLPPIHALRYITPS